MSFVAPEDIERLAKKLAPFLKLTPLETGKGQLSGLLLKREDLQHTNSFTVRAALGIMMSLSDEQESRGLVLTTPGNLGWGLAYAMAQLEKKTRLKIVIPEDAVEAKRLGLLENSHSNISVIRKGFSEEERYKIVREISEREGFCEMTLHNRRAEVAAKGTIAVEIIEQLKNHSGKKVVSFYCPIGSGALAAGCAIELKAVLGNQVRIVGVEPRTANDFSLLFHSGQVSSDRAPSTVADSLRSPAVRAEYRETLLELVDDVVEVDDIEILNAMKLLHADGAIVSEPSSAAAVAAVAAVAKTQRNKTSESHDIVVLTASNVDRAQYDFFRGA